MRKWIMNPNVKHFKINGLDILFFKDSLQKIFLSPDEVSLMIKLTQNLESSEIERKFKECLIKTGVFVEEVKGKFKLEIPKANQNNINNNKLKTLIIKVTDKCNLNCPLCFIENNLPKIDLEINDTTFENIKLFFENSIDNPEVIIIGGEPLLFPEKINIIIQYIDSIRNDKDITFTIGTNGTIINSEIIVLCKRYSIQIDIGLEGMKEVHALSKSLDERVFKTITENIKKYQANHISVGITSSVGSHNIFELKKNIDYFTKILNADRLSFNILYYKYNKETPFYIDYADHWKELFESQQICHGQSIYFDILDKHLIPLIDEKNLGAFCPISGKQMVILPNNELTPCYGLNYEMAAKEGLLFNTFQDFYKKIVVESFVKEKMLAGKCKDCEFFGFCGGGCAFNRIVKMGSLTTPDPMHCKLIRKLFEETLTRLSE